MSLAVFPLPEQALPPERLDITVFVHSAKKSFVVNHAFSSASVSNCVIEIYVTIKWVLKLSSSGHAVPVDSSLISQ
jgi:hypothetical protein